MSYHGMAYYMNAMQDFADDAIRSNDYDRAQVFETMVSYLNRGHGQSPDEFLRTTLSSSECALAYAQEGNQSEEIVSAWNEVIELLNQEIALGG